MKRNRDTEKEREQARIRYHNNAEFYRAKARDWHRNNREKCREASLRWHHENKARASATLKAWRAKNRAHVKDYTKRKLATDPSYRISVRLRSRLSEILTYKGTKKAVKTEALVGCTVLELRAWLEGQFHDGMNWGNRGNQGWEVDHRVPCCAFDHTYPEQVKKCFHYTNLRPLWAKDNREKNKRIEAA